jgi:hypothetical protein
VVRPAWLIVGAVAGVFGVVVASPAAAGGGPCVEPADQTPPGFPVAIAATSPTGAVAVGYSQEDRAPAAVWITQDGGNRFDRLCADTPALRP